MKLEDVPTFLIRQFEGGYHPTDEPPGLEEASYKAWKDSGFRSRRVEVLDPGISLRDYFAAHCVQCNEGKTYKQDAEAAYDMADAMLEARKPKAAPINDKICSVCGAAAITNAEGLGQGVCPKHIPF